LDYSWHQSLKRFYEATLKYLLNIHEIFIKKSKKDIVAMIF